MELILIESPNEISTHRTGAQLTKRNYIYFYGNGKIKLVLVGYKSSDKHGTRVIPLPDRLTNILTLYKTKIRPELLRLCRDKNLSQWFFITPYGND